MKKVIIILAIYLLALPVSAQWRRQPTPNDIAYNNCKETLGYLDEFGIGYTYMENAQGGHSWITWRADLATLAPTLFK